MNLEGRLPFDPRVLGAVSHRLSAALFSVLPQLQPYALTIKSGEKDGLSLVLKIPSPTGDPDRQLTIWVDDIGTPSIGFGQVHTHENQQDDGIEAIIERAKAVLEDKLLIIEDVGGTYSGHISWIDFREPDALEEELTSRYSPGRALLKSWSGSADRCVSTESL